MNTEISLLLISINKLIGEEITLPGNWSPKLFYEDIMNAPVQNSDVLISTMKRLALEWPSYLDFFFTTRGYHKNVTEYQKELYTLFSKGSLMLYFEEIFLFLLNNYFCLLYFLYFM